MKIIAKDNDRNRDGLVTFEDLKEDSEFYDVNSKIFGMVFPQQF